MKKVSGYILLVFILVLLITNPQGSVYYAQKGITLCIDTVIPSLFPFLVCSELLIYSGFCEVLSKILSPVMKPVFNINPQGSAAFILGLLSGYPQGTIAAVGLYEEGYISKPEAERLLAFCNNSGPLFILGTVGISMYHSPKAGILLYIAHILGAISTGFVFRFYHEKTPTGVFTSKALPISDAGKIFSLSISDSVKSMLSICASILFCSVISNLLLDLLCLNPAADAGFSSILEFVSGLEKISYLNTDTVKKLILSAAVCAFAGVSVHLQVLSIASQKGLSLVPYITGKLMHTLFAAFYTFILLTFFPLTKQVFCDLSYTDKINAGCFCGSLFCILPLIVSVLSVLIFSIVIHKKTVRIKSKKNKKRFN